MRKIGVGTVVFITLAMIVGMWLGTTTIMLEAQSVGSRIVQLVTESKIVPVGDGESITDLSSSTALTVPTGATSAFIQAQTGNIRWRDGSTAPTPTVGGIIYAGDYLPYNGDLTTIRLIEESSADAFVFYYRPP